MSDLSHHYEALDRALKRIGIILVDDHGHLRSGKSAQCIALLRKILLFTSSVLAQQMLLRGCPSHAPDKRLVISAFDLVREKIKYSPSITVDQFLKEGYAVHKISVLLKLAIFVLDTDKGMIKTPPPKVMYVVPPDDLTPSSMDLGSTPIPVLSSLGSTPIPVLSSLRTADNAVKTAPPPKVMYTGGDLALSSLDHRDIASSSLDHHNLDRADSYLRSSKSRPVSVGNSSGIAATINTPAVLAVEMMQNSSSSSYDREDNDSAAYFPPHMAAVNNDSSFKLITNDNSIEENDPPLVPRWIAPSRPSMLESFAPLYAQSTSSNNNESNRLINVFDESFEYTFPEDNDTVRAMSNPLSASVTKTRGAASPGRTPSSAGNSDSHKLDFGDLFSSVVPTALRQQLYRSSSSRSSSPATAPRNSLHVRLPIDSSRATAANESAGSSAPDRGFSGPSSSPLRQKPLQTGLGAPRLQHLSTADMEPVLQYIDEAIRKGITNNEFLTKSLEERIDSLVENRVEAALTDMSTKYDFIINKIVTSVDAEFNSVYGKIGAISSQLK